MFTLIKNANLYSPEHLGMNDVLLADDKICLLYTSPSPRD